MSFFNLYRIIVRDQVDFLEPVTWLGRSAARLFSLLPALPITLRLMKFDRLIGERGMAAAADWLLKRYYRGYVVSSPAVQDKGIPADSGTGELLFANHVGLADVLALLSWRGRNDVYIITKERALLRGLPALGERIVSIGTSPAERRAMLHRTEELLTAGALVVLFPAGRIENDPWHLSAGETAVVNWSGLLGYLIGRGQKQGFNFVLQPVLTGNVYAPAARSIYNTLRFGHHTDTDKYLAFFTFIFRLSRYQHVRLIPDRQWKFEDIPRGMQGKKALTGFFRQRLVMLTENIPECCHQM